MSKRLNLAHIYKENVEIQPKDMSQLKGGDGCVCVIDVLEGVSNSIAFSAYDGK